MKAESVRGCWLSNRESRVTWKGEQTISRSLPKNIFLLKLFRKKPQYGKQFFIVKCKKQKKCEAPENKNKMESLDLPNNWKREPLNSENGKPWFTQSWLDGTRVGGGDHSVPQLWDWFEGGNYISKGEKRSSICFFAFVFAISSFAHIDCNIILIEM